MLYTSRFANPELKTGDYTPVRISLGAPRWRTGYTLAGAIKELMPAGLRQIQDIEEFSLKYYKRLDSFGVDVIKKQLQHYESLGKLGVLRIFVKAAIIGVTELYLQNGGMRVQAKL